MKITLDIPDDTTGAFFTFLNGYIGDLNLRSHGISQRELYDGAVIKIDVNKGGASDGSKQ